MHGCVEDLAAVRDEEDWLVTVEGVLSSRAECTDEQCDVCATDTCTDCSVGFILNTTGTCVSACPAGEYGVVESDLQCTCALQTKRP